MPVQSLGSGLGENTGILPVRCFNWYNVDQTATTATASYSNDGKGNFNQQDNVLIYPHFLPLNVCVFTVMVQPFGLEWFYYSVHCISFVPYEC